MPRTGTAAKNKSSSPGSAPAIPESTPTSLSSQADKDPNDQQNRGDISGLYLFGRISDRARRTIPIRNLSSTEIVTYTVEDAAGHRYYVDEYSPREYNDVGSEVSLPVYVKTFKKRNGDIGYSFCIQQQQIMTSRGERF